MQTFHADILGSGGKPPQKHLKIWCCEIKSDNQLHATQFADLLYVYYPVVYNTIG